VFCALTRTKYVPFGTLLMLHDVCVLPVGKLPRLLQPAAVPAASTYVVGAPPLSGALQLSVNAFPLTVAAS
jgi:hypothetical protein